MQHRIHRCANGLTALVAPQRDLPLVSLQVWVETGSAQEGEWAGSGLSHLLEHMVFKGTERFSGLELNERVPALGGLWNAYTSTDRTVFYIDGPSTSWREFLELLVQLCLHPTFPREEFEREREVIRREMAMCDDDPQDVAYNTLISTLYRRHPRRLPVIGERAAFDALRYEDMVAYHRRRYAPSNIFICAAGDVEPEAFFAALEAAVADVAPRAVPESTLPIEPRQWGPRLCRRSFAQPTSTLMLAWRIPPSDSADAAPLALLVSLLGEGRSAWLYKHLHDELGLVHDVSVFALPEARSEGALVVELDVERERRDAARRELLAFMESLTRAEWGRARQRTRRQMRTARLRTLSTVQGMATALGMSWHLTRNADCAEEWEAALDAVTDADLQRVAAAYLTPQRLTEVSIDPLQPAGEEAPAAEHTPAAAASDCRVLPNGLRLVTRADARVPMVALTFCCA
ncbi:MAG: M16 family metallopeptidase, partial [Akkermansia sp.]